MGAALAQAQAGAMTAEQLAVAAAKEKKKQEAKQMLEALANNYQTTSPGVGAPQEMLGLMQSRGFTPMQGGGSQTQIDSGLLEALMAQMQNRM